MEEHDSDWPLIGICSRPSDTNADESVFSTAYADAVQDAGGIPIALPFGFEVASIASKIISRIDGLLLTGGGDITPDGFGGNIYAKHCVAKIAFMSAERDVFEWAAVRAAWDRDIPCLGICRGLQVMNVSFGGTLVRDAMERGATIMHWQQDRRFEPVHDVWLSRDSHLARIMGTDILHVNSIHHQAISTPASEARIVGRASDGVPEAIEFPNKHFFMGVQWHPEMLGTMPQIFEAFVNACRSEAKARATS